MIEYNDYNTVQMRITQARAESKGWHENIIRWRKLYDLHHYKKRKPNEPQFSDPTYTNTVDLAVGMLMANEMKWRAYGWKPSLGEQEDSSKIEKFLAGTLEINSERNEYLIPYQVLLHFARDGAAVVYSVWDKSIAKRTKESVEMPDDDSERGVRAQLAYGEVPVLTQVIDPLKMHFIAGGPHRWLAAIRTEQLSAYDCETTYGVTLKEFTGRTAEEKAQMRGELVDYWDFASTAKGDDVEFVVRNCVLFNQEIIHPLREMEGYDDLPYTVDFFKPVDLDDSGGWGHSILQPLQGPVEMLEASINRRQFQIDLYTSLPLVARTQQGRKVDMDPALGSVVTLSLEEELNFPQWQGNPPDVREQIDFLRSRVQQSGFSDVMYGSGANQVSGYAMSQLGDQNRIRLEQPVAHLEMLWTRWAKKVLRMVGYFAPTEMIRVYGRMKGVDFVDMVMGSEAKHYMVKCQITPEFPNEKVRNHAMASQVRGILSETTIMENYLGIEQPDDERQKKLVELMQTHPLAQNYALIAELKRRVEEDEDEVAELTLQALMNNGLAGMPGRPGEPPNPEQMMGTQSPTGGMVPTAGNNEEAPPGAFAAPNMAGGVA